jgi:hypothetical protein
MAEAKKWIFRFKGNSDVANASDLLSVLNNHSIKILDNALPKMVLVSGSEKEIESAHQEIGNNWTVARENSSYPIPDTKKKLKRS